MNERDVNGAKPALRARLEELGAKRWTELAGVRLAWVHGGVWLALGERFVRAPRTFEELNEALRGSQAELESEASFGEVMELVELWRDGGADFVRLQVDRATRSISIEVIDSGWFEIAASLG